MKNKKTIPMIMKIEKNSALLRKGSSALFVAE